MSEIPRQGALATRQGRVLEETVVSVFQGHGFEVVGFPDWSRHPERFGKELVIRNVPYTSIYGHQGKTEFLVRSERFALEIRIECKWQQSSGSVDEKFPYLYLNCVEAMPEREIIVIVDGGGFRAEALAWLKAKAAATTQKAIRVMSLSEFIQWANQALR